MQSEFPRIYGSYGNQKVIASVLVYANVMLRKNRVMWRSLKLHVGEVSVTL